MVVSYQGYDRMGVYKEGSNTTRRRQQPHEKRERADKRGKAQLVQEEDETVDAGKQAGPVNVRDNQKCRDYRRSTDVQ